MSSLTNKMIVRQYERPQAAALLVAIEEGFGPLHLPDFNPFIQFYNKNYTDTEFRGSFTDAHCRKLHELATKIEHANRMKRQFADLAVLRFCSSHIPSSANAINTYCRHLDEEIKRVIDGHVMMVKGLEDEHIEEILKGWPGIGEQNYGQQREWAMTYARNAQHKTCKTLLRNVNRLIETSGDLAAWRAASTEEIENLLAALFDQFPLTISKLIFHTEDGSVNFERIWRNCFDDGKRQTLLCSKFIHLAMSTWLYRIKTNNKDKT